MTFPEILKSLSDKLGIEITDEGGATAVEIDGQSVLLCRANDDLLFIQTDIGELASEGRKDILTAAMVANFLYQGTGGSTLAFNPLDGHIHLQKYNWMERLDADTTLDMLSRFADTAVLWRKILADRKVAEKEPFPTGNGNLSPSIPPNGFIQV